MTETVAAQPASPRKSRLLRVREAAVWQPIRSGWRQLYGAFYELGVSIEWQDFQVGSAFEWSRSFHPESLELCLNLAGQGWVNCQGSALNFEPLTVGFYLPGRGMLQGTRQAGQRHRFLTVEFSARYLREHLAVRDGALHPLVEGFVRNGSQLAGLGQLHRLTAEQERLVTRLLHPPCVQAARPLWYQSQVLALMAECFFERRGEEELLCDRQKRLARERADRVIGLLRQQLAEPPSLEELARKVGCSAFYLSRTFSAETGMTIPQYLRKLRLERAAELLRNGQHNVTEAAMEVGYSSLSHFSQAFCQTMGCCPGLYPVRAVQAVEDRQAGPPLAGPKPLG